ncbi:hypothetical protein ACFU8W_29515 [Streptomyces sp. NPDC057565]|uniref:hypothetical protein n=1 Tax=Streptomyces sp. NPDC057565 TaxID=3346169 RepID=UPI0036CF14EA
MRRRPASTAGFTCEENISTGAVLVTPPTLIAFLFLQQYLCNGFTRGATRTNRHPDCPDNRTT